MFNAADPPHEANIRVFYWAGAVAGGYSRLSQTAVERLSDLEILDSEANYLGIFDRLIVGGIAHLCPR